MASYGFFFSCVGSVEEEGMAWQASERNYACWLSKFRWLLK